MCTAYTDDDYPRILGFRLYSNVLLTEEKLEPILDDLIDSVTGMIGPDFNTANYTIEAGVYDWGNGLNDIRVWRVFSG